MQEDTPKLVVTLPSGTDPLAFAQRAKAVGADLLEVRDDLTPALDNVDSVTSVLPILLARRTEQHLSPESVKCAAIVDQDISFARHIIEGPRQMLSFHSETPLEMELAVNLWRAVATKSEAIKHVEPYEPGCEYRLIGLRKVLRRFCPDVTVLAMGSGSEEARRLLSIGNSLHYCCLDSATASAPGQALLADEVMRLKRFKGNQ